MILRSFARFRGFPAWFRGSPAWLRGSPAWLGAAVCAGLGLAACEYPASSRIERNPVAYVRPAPQPPFAEGARAGDRRLAPYVAVTVPPPQPPEPRHPPSRPLPPENPSWWESLLYGASAGVAKAGDVIIDQAEKLSKPVPAPVVKVPAYTAPVYGPGGARPES